MTDGGAQIFISYGRSDAAGFAVKLADWLRSQGYHPWLDVENGIPIGAPFDIRIELGIAGSDLLIALLSPRSLRPEGFCRNELLFAQAHAKPIVPVRIADVVPPIQIISLSYIDAASDPDAAFEQLPVVIEAARNSRRSPTKDRLFPGAAPAWWASVPRLSFADELGRHGGSFIGRTWLFEQLKRWTQHRDSRLLLLTADAGVGKSAIAAQMTARLNLRGVHFCSRSNLDSCRAAAWVGGLMHQLGAQFGAYRNRIALIDAPKWDNPSSLFRTLISDPLLASRDEIDVSEPWVFVVDGLDEAVAAAGFDFPDLLADAVDAFPSWLRLIVTTRPDDALLARFRINGADRDHLEARGEANLADVHAYVEERVARLGKAGSSDATHEELCVRISALAGGNFLFARMTLDALADPIAEYRLTPIEVGALPPRLGGLYHAMFRRRFPDLERYEREVLPLIECLVAARDPLPEPLLLAAARLDDRVARRGLRALSQFLNRGSKGVALFHKSLADWLGDAVASAEFYASCESGNRCLADACWEEYQRSCDALSDYGLSNLLTHLVTIRRWESVDELLKNLLYLEAKARRATVFDVADDFTRAIEAMPPTRPTRRLLGLIDEAIRAEAHFVARHPETLFQCLWNSCWWYDSHPTIDQSGRESPSVPSELKLSHLAEVWRSTKERAHPGFVWIRSRRPSLRRIGSAKKVVGGHKRQVMSVALSPDERRVASGAADSTVRLWDVMTGEEVRCFRGHAAPVTSVVFSQDGRRIYAASWDGTVREWDIDRACERRCLRGHEGGVYSVAVSESGEFIVSGGEDGSVRVWNAGDGHQTGCLCGHQGRVRCVAISLDGSLIASGSDDGAVRLWNALDGVEIHCLSGHHSSVTSLVVSRDGRTVVSRSWDEIVRVWDVETGRCLEVLPGLDALVAIAEGPLCYPFRARSYVQETAIETADTSLPIAWLPTSMRSTKVSASGHVWAGATGPDLHIFTLEGRF